MIRLNTKLSYLFLFFLFISIGAVLIIQSSADTGSLERPNIKKAKSLSEISEFNTERYLHEYYRQANTETGKIPYDQKELELTEARLRLTSPQTNRQSISIDYRSRGPSNLGGRARALVIDKSDPSENTMLAGGVSGGVFRTTDGGTNWVKVSPNDAVFNVTTIAQDPRSGFENIWYYGTGEFIGNSASLSGAIYRGQGIWKSVDGGITWNQMPGTNSDFTAFDSDFDYVFRLAVHPVTGDVYAACLKNILRFNGASWVSELEDPLSSTNLNQSSDVVITNSGRVYLSYGGGNSPNVEGVWTSSNGIGNWIRISNGTFTPTGRVTLGLAPSNQNKLYCFYYNGNGPDTNNFNNNCPVTPGQEVDLWLWDQDTEDFTNYSDRLAYEGGCLIFNDPFTTFSGYTMSIAVKPDDENFVVIGGSNAYKIGDITNTNTRFQRIGGYISSTSYGLYDLAGDTHHPDLHVFAFSENNPNVMYSASDGGIHKTNNIQASTVGWENLNNDFQTYQYYHVTLNQEAGSDLVLGGTQDNGTSVGGTEFNFGTITDLTSQIQFLSGDGVAVAIANESCEGNPTYYMGVQNGTIYRICNQFDLITPNNSQSQFVTYFYMDETANNVLYYAGLGNLYRTTDALNVSPNSWNNLGSLAVLGANDRIQRLAASMGTYNPLNSYLLIGGDEGRILRLDDPRNSITIGSAIDITPEGAAIGFPSIVTGLAVHPSNNDIVMATYSNYGNQSIFITTNATSPNPSWTLVERNLSAFSIRSAAIIENEGDILYLVGTARGLYSSTDPLTNDWQLEAANDIGIALISDLDYRAADSHFLIGTHGNGMYEGIPSQTLSVPYFEPNQWTVFPNPVTDKLHFTGVSDLTRGNFIIYDITGKQVVKGTLKDHSINVSKLKEGLYFLDVQTQTGILQAKFIKQ